MTKKDLIRAIAIKSGQSQQSVATIVDAFLGVVEESVAAGQRVSLPGFGTFDVRMRSARVATNPGTGLKMTVAAKVVPTFAPGKHLKDAASVRPVE